MGPCSPSGRDAPAPAGHGRPPDTDARRNGPMDAAAGGPKKTAGAPASCEDAGSGNYLDHLHFCVPVTVLDDGAPPGALSAVNVTLYGRFPALQATEVV